VGYSGWDHMGTGMGGVMGWGFGGLLMILFVVVAVVVVAMLFRGFSGRTTGIDLPPREKSPLDVLKERYARGDIGREEFEQKKGDLQ
jgi:putative membrane protein